MASCSRKYRRSVFDSAAQVDANASGISYILGFGEYSEGHLWLMDGTNAEDRAADGPVSSTPTETGNTAYGTLRDLHNSWLAFRSSTPYAAMGPAGARVCLDAASHVA